MTMRSRMGLLSFRYPEHNRNNDQLQAGKFRMSDKHSEDTELHAALRSLLLDIEEMYEGAEISPDSGDEEEYFGPFSTGKIDGIEIGDVRVSWPNLAISMRRAREALRKVEENSTSTQ